jgi:hypothetical protein
MVCLENLFSSHLPLQFYHYALLFFSKKIGFVFNVGMLFFILFYADEPYFIKK